MSAFDQFSREDLIMLILHQQDQITQLISRVESLERDLSKRGGGPPSWVKPNARGANKEPKGGEEAERKKRSQSFTRPLENATEVVFHTQDHCPDCNHELSGGWEHSRRQVIEVPPTPIRIIDHVVVGRYCAYCKKRCLPSLDLSDQVIGRHRIGIGLMSLIGYLRSECRLPINGIKGLLFTLYGLKISRGKIVDVLHTISEHGKGCLKQMLEQVRGSSCVHADETGWRENGQNGYIWSFSTPSLRYFHYDRSRAGAVPRDILGEEFDSVLVSDFYGAYNSVGNCNNQRCWVHLLRDLHKLKESYPKDTSVKQWAKQIKSLYKQAILYQKRCLQAMQTSSSSFGYNILQRRDKRRDFESRLAWLALPYLKEKGQDADPQTVLAQRLDRFASELFVFIEHPHVPSENNAAERAVRPCVIARKISGGTRSDKGSKTRMDLMSLFGTWKIQNANPIQECRKMLAIPIA